MNEIRRTLARTSIAIVVWLLFASDAFAQAMPVPSFRSVGRGWPVEPALPSSGRDPPALGDFDPDLAVGPLRVQIHGAEGTVSRTVQVGAAWDGNVPHGVQPLPIDLFSADDVYKDRASWSDPRSRRVDRSVRMAFGRDGDLVCVCALESGTDLYGRPWAKLWEEYFERGMQKPKSDDLFDFR